MNANAAGTAGEIHRYFPEWADRPAGPASLQEADRNSYLAGGYADEFGYGRHAESPPAIPPLLGDPESSGLWREQIGALHPGYPQCPKPLDRYVAPEDGSRHFGPPADRGAGTSADRLRAHTAVVGFQVLPVRSRARAPLSRRVFHIGVVAFVAERLIRRRHLNDVL